MKTYTCKAFRPRCANSVTQVAISDRVVAYTPLRPAAWVQLPVGVALPLIAGIKRTCVGWQVTLCDPIKHGPPWALRKECSCIITQYKSSYIQMCIYTTTAGALLVSRLPFPPVPCKVARCVAWKKDRSPVSGYYASDFSFAQKHMAK